MIFDLKFKLCSVLVAGRREENRENLLDACLLWLFLHPEVGKMTFSEKSVKFY
jgi:hypothetical protein